VRHVSLAEAQAAIPRLKPLLAELRDAYHEWRWRREELAELQAVHGDALFTQELPDSADARRLRDEVAALTVRIDGILARVDELGAEVKDPLLGLVDFYALRGEETVLLCYRDDEPALAHWHTLTSGFAGRRPLSEY